MSDRYHVKRIINVITLVLIFILVCIFRFQDLKQNLLGYFIMLLLFMICLDNVLEYFLKLEMKAWISGPLHYSTDIKKRIYRFLIFLIYSFICFFLFIGLFFYKFGNEVS